jgi:hypothetical protein
MDIIAISESGTKFSSLFSIGCMNESGTVSKMRFSFAKVPKSDLALAEHSLPAASDDRVCVVSDLDIAFPCLRHHVKQSKDSGLLIISADGSVPLIRKVLESGMIKNQNIIVYGNRTFAPETKDFLDRNKIRCFPAKLISLHSLHDTADGMTEIVNSWPAAFLALDLSILDPAFADVGQESGGFTSRELIYILQRLKLMKDLKTIFLKSDKEIPILSKLLIEVG